jgi:hypothetical protein
MVEMVDMERQENMDPGAQRVQKDGTDLQDLQAWLEKTVNLVHRVQKEDKAYLDLLEKTVQLVPQVLQEETEGMVSTD